MIITKKISLETKGDGDIIDITPQVEQKVVEANLNSGTVTVFVAGSTAGVTTIEFEPGLVADFKHMWERNTPRNIPYDHDRRWGDGNGYSHVRASLLGPSLVVPFSDKKMLLGTWQQIVLVDFDNRPRSRQIVLQIMGE
ncbi:MAG: secondary thiamine-phosphate synthase enzyme YjbQ [Dehalococcoidales bacterium]|nr:secondary thiamine-phosphate synthase enzyme YjbQ [Dehalococcoidales bacterium]